MRQRHNSEKVAIQYGAKVSAPTEVSPDDEPYDPEVAPF